MMKKIIYYVSVVSIIFLGLLLLGMLPLIFECGYKGILFIISVILTIIFELIFIVFNKNYIKNNWVNNLFIIVATIYTGIIYYKLYNTYLLYKLEFKYYESNYLIASIIFFIILSNMIITGVSKNKN